MIYKPTKLLLYFFLQLVCYSSMAQPNLLPSDSLEARFLKPPTSVKPYVWWHWMGSNFSKTGITKDLEAMKAAGIGGATIFNLSSAVQESNAPTQNNPWPEQTYRSPAYWEALRFAAAEADRLGLEIGLHNSPGYSCTGGPWIDESRSMKKLVWRTASADADSVSAKITQQNKNAVPVKSKTVSVTITIASPDLPVFQRGGGFSPERRATQYVDIALLAYPEGGSAKDVVNLTHKMNRGGEFTWEMPAGKWTFYRLGYASTMAYPAPSPDDVVTSVLEVDKMSGEQNRFHWNSVVNPIQEHLGEYVGKSFRHILIDSYEANFQNWTPDFREEFIGLKGYDPLPWMISMGPVITNNAKNTKRIILVTDSLTKRFEYDYADVINRLFTDKGWKIAREVLHASNLILQHEPYSGQFNTLEGVANADLPMGEFWSNSTSGIDGIIPAAARAAGKRVVGAEAATGRPEVSMYTEDPASLKSCMDGGFASGVNRMILHHWVHQPFDDKYQPGMGMGWWGTHFGRHQTWFEPGKAFFNYLGRCQAMLQYGEQVADYLCVEKMQGFSDVISVNDFLKDNIEVRNGAIVLPSGRTYPFIVFSNNVMIPEVALKIKDLVSLGATVVSPKPTLSPSLKNYPECDEIVKKLGNEVWGNGTSTDFGKGTILLYLEDALKKFKITEDYIIGKSNDMKILHRREHNTDIYFVANLSKNPQAVSVSFRIAGKQPELWQAEDGSISNATVWSEKEGRTSVDLKLNGLQTLFVVFRKPADQKDHLVAMDISGNSANWNLIAGKNGRTVLCSSDTLLATAKYASGRNKVVKINPSAAKMLSGEWDVSFVPKLETPFQLVFPQLIDFSKHADKKVNYFAGTASYSKTIILKASELAKGKRIILDLGEMYDIALVKINGRDKGVLWYPPYVIDITDALKSGENKLEIAVTNNWANRLIGDEQEPTDFEWGKDRGEKMGRAMLAYPDWFIKNEPRPSQGRKTFSVWYYYRKDSPLKPAGLVGPMRLVFASEVEL